jgi:hypothetical protein
VRLNVFEDISMAKGGHQTIVSTLAESERPIYAVSPNTTRSVYSERGAAGKVGKEAQHDVQHSLDPERV